MIRIYGEKVKGVWYCIAFDDTKIFALSFGFDEKKALQSLLETLPYGTMFTQMEKPAAFHKSVVNTLSSIYEGEPVSSVFPLAIERLPNVFQQALKAAAFIPCGYVATYGGIAKVCKTGPRVVGRAMATNPFPLLIPCHRVVCSNLTLAGHGPRRDLRRNILEREQRGFQKNMEIQVFGKTLSLFPVEKVMRRPS